MAKARNAADTFTTATDKWRETLLEMDEIDFLKRCQEYASHLSTAVMMFDAQPAGDKLSDEVQHAYDVVDGDSAYFQDLWLELTQAEFDRDYRDVLQALKSNRKSATPTNVAPPGISA